MITIEDIDGKKRLVVWHAEVVAPIDDAIRQVWLQNNVIELFCDFNLGHFATALPPLPRHIKNDEATNRLLCLYRAYGITLAQKYVGSVGDREMYIGAITHATYKGEEIELVFEGDE